MKITLSEEQKQKLEEQHKTERDRRICDLKPIERVWKVMNEHVRNNTVLDSFTEFKAKTNKVKI